MSFLWCLFCVQVEIEQLNFRLSYNDIKLFLAIAQSLPSLESKEQRPDALKKYEREIKGVFCHTSHNLAYHKLHSNCIHPPFVKLC